MSENMSDTEKEVLNKLGILHTTESTMNIYIEDVLLKIIERMEEIEKKLYSLEFPI